jgi:hypothetical protein
VLSPASRMVRMILGAPVAVVVALACLMTIGPVPDREDNKGSANRGSDSSLQARTRTGRLRRARR